MKTEDQINRYINEQAEPKRSDMLELHNAILKMKPASKLWYLDGRNAESKIVTNPNAGYGSYTIKYADGKSKEFYQVGMSANTSGISIYIMGINDKKLLAEKFGKSLGKASVTGYCIKFKELKDIDKNVLKEAIRFGFEFKQQ
jgi:hypothetical protein